MDNANGHLFRTTMPFSSGNGANISGCFEPTFFLPRDVNGARRREDVQNANRMNQFQCLPRKNYINSNSLNVLFQVKCLVVAQKDSVKNRCDQKGQ